jgi:hypothetical protein
LSIIKTNITQPYDRKIRIIPIFPTMVGSRYVGDSTTKFLAEKFNHPNPQGWQAPVMVLDNPIIDRRFNTTIRSMGNRILVYGAYTEKSYSAFLKEYLR